MARIRTIKPDFCQSETLGTVSRDARLCFVQLWTFVDDEGRCRAATRILAGSLFPFDEDAVGALDGWLAELEKIDCVFRYQVGGTTYLQIRNWKKHQKIDRASASRLPAPPGFDDGSTSPREDVEQPRLPLDAGPRTLDLGPRTPDHSRADADVGDESSPSALFFEAYPKHEAEDGVARELTRRLASGVDLDDIVAGAKRYRAEVAGRPPDKISGPVAWLRDGRWKDGLRKTIERPVEMGVRVDRDTPEGRAWVDHERAQGRPIPKWILAAGSNGPGRHFGSRWPPGAEPPAAKGVAA